MLEELYYVTTWVFAPKQPPYLRDKIQNLGILQDGYMNN